MKIKWNNIVALILIALIIFGTVKFVPLVNDILEDINDTYDYGPGRMLIKFMFVGLLCVTAVVIAKFLSGN